MYINHHTKGFTSVIHKNKNIVTSVPSEEFEDYLNKLSSLPYRVGFIPLGYEHRADLISDLFYNTPIYDWLICYFNNVSDPFNQLNVGDRILIPSI